MKYTRPFAILLLLVAAGGFLLYSAFVDVRKRAIDQLNAEQLILAKQASKSIRGFFDHYSHLLSHLSTISHIASLDQQGKDLMQVFYETHANEIRSVTRVDSRGRVMCVFPENPDMEGADLSRQEHIQRLIQAHRPVLSDVFKAGQGFDGIAFHVPVFVNEVFQGSLGILASFDHLARESLEDIKLGEDGYAWIISRKGIELYCPVPGHVGRSVFENCKGFPDILAMAREMIQGKAGTATYVFGNIRGQTTELIKKHAVYLPIQLADTFWSVVVATPEREALGSIRGFRDRWLLVIGVLLIAVAFCFYYFGRALIIMREDEKHKQAEDALRVSEKRLRRAEVVARFGNWEFILGRDEVKASDGARIIYGLGDKEWSIGDVRKIPLPEYRSMLDQTMSDLIEKGKPYSVEFKIRRPSDGQIRDIHSIAEYSPAEKIVFGVIQDIGERRLAEEALRSSGQQLRHERALLRALIDSIPDLIFFKDKDSVYLGCNKAFEIYSGMEERELIGKTDLDIASREVAEFYRRMDREMFATGKARRNEEWIPFKSSGGAYFDTLKTPYYGPDGELLGLIGVSRDITERKRLAEALEQRLVALTCPLDAVGNVELEDLFDLEEIQKLQDQFAEATGVASIITHVDGTPITNPSNFCRLCEDIIRRTEKGLKNCYYSDSIIGSHSSEGPIVQQCLSGGLWDAGASISVAGRHIANWLIGQVRDETQVEAEMRAYAEEIGADEKTFMEAFHEVPSMSRDQFGKVAQALYTLAGQLSSMAYQNIQQARFITELKRAEEEKGSLEAQLIHAQKMESVGRLAGGVAHDFNNMLGVIMGHAELALNRVEVDGALYQDLREILEAANRSADLTRQLLAFARKQTVSPKVLDLNVTIEGMLKMLRRLIGEDIDLVWMPGHDLWMVKIDPSQIDQMLANLAINARDAISGIGKVTIETNNVVLDESTCSGRPEFAPGEYVLLSVSDTGAGMGKDVLDHIFEPFFTTKEVGQGTGLGLATVYGIVKQNDGFVDVYSEPNLGTTFKIYLPRYAEFAFQAPTEALTGKIPEGTETVLIVEDEEAILTIAKTILDRLGYTVLIANSPVQALRLAGEYVGDIHLLITDVVMPEMNGRELANRLTAAKPGLKCLFMSGYTANIIAHHSVLDEGVHFIPKPFSVKALAEKAREALDE